MKNVKIRRKLKEKGELYENRIKRLFTQNASYPFTGPYFGKIKSPLPINLPN